MNIDLAVWLLISTAIVLANIPWFFSNRLFLVITVPHKKFWLSALEWCLYFGLMAGFAYLLEKNAMGAVQSQDWEFYAVNVFMFAIFSFPGFIYRYNLRKFLK